ncbi:MAG TPA: RIP metalloprotease RseP [Rhizomicrobium sp.]
MLHMLQGFTGWLIHGLPAYLFVITAVVFFHELGHFSVARFFDVTVETFSIGFGRALVKWTDSKGTLWKISWFPFGGFVKFLGDDNAASVPDRAKLEKLTPEQRANVFAGKPLYQRALVVVAGPVANFILAIVIFAFFFMIAGKQILIPVVGAVQPHSAAAAAGILPGDLIRSVDGHAIESFSDMQTWMEISAGRTIPIAVERKGAAMTLNATPQLKTIKDLFGNQQRVGVLGVISQVKKENVRVIHFGPIAAVGEACKQVWSIVSTTLTYMGRIVAGQQDTSQLQGPLGIAKVSGQVASLGILALIQLAALLSVSIGLINLFPVPILDGGHLLYYGCEAVLGRPLGERAQDVGFRLGLMAVLGLFVLATWNDLVRLNLF